MRILPLVSALIAGAFLVACEEKSNCSTRAEFEKKAEAAAVQFNEFATKNPERLMELAPKFEGVMSAMPEGEDFSKACAVIDEMLAIIG